MGQPSVAVVMAAGKGTRMKSDLPKVLVPVRGRPMIGYVLDALERAGIGRAIVVVGYRAADVQEALAGRKRVDFALQEEQLGTGHAVMMCRQQLAGHRGPVLIVAGDSPMMQPESLQALLADFERRPAACILGTGFKDNPTGLGRIVRDSEGQFERIVEEKDATGEQKAICEVNFSCYVFACQDLLWAARADSCQQRPARISADRLPGRIEAGGQGSASAGHPQADRGPQHQHDGRLTSRRAGHAVVGELNTRSAAASQSVTRSGRHV